MKFTKFVDIPQSTQDGQWECAFSLSSFVRQIDEWTDEDLNMNPDFQRNHVWSIEQSRAYIEALLQDRAKNARVVYLNHPGWKDTYNGDFVCVDGLQRYTAIKMFIENKLDVFSSYYKEFEDSIRCVNAMIKININTLQTKKEVLQWYLDLNTGGVVHSNQEIEIVKEMIKEL
jgi:uncharacterized protein with ParB-like and HNH nuclease domain